MQTEGRERAFVTFKTISNRALLLKASQRHSALVLNTVFKPAQHFPSGFAAVLSFDTKDKQSAMLNIRLVQSTEEGAGADAGLWEQQEIEKVQRRIRDNTFLDAIFLFLSLILFCRVEMEREIVFFFFFFSKCGCENGIGEVRSISGEGRMALITRRI